MANKEQTAEKGFECLSVTSVIVKPFSDGVTMGKILGYATVVLNEQLTIRDLRVMDGVNGLYVAYPNDPFYSDKVCRPILSPITTALREHIEHCVLEKYLHETGKATLKFDVELTHRTLFGAILHMEIIATSEKEAKSKAKEKAIEIIPSTKDAKDEWRILKLKQHE